MSIETKIPAHIRMTAEQIERACECHDALVEALQTCLQDPDLCHYAANKAKAALKQAGAE